MKEIEENLKKYIYPVTINTELCGSWTEYRCKLGNCRKLKNGRYSRHIFSSYNIHNIKRHLELRHNIAYFTAYDRKRLDRLKQLEAKVYG